jgi:serine protease
MRAVEKRRLGLGIVAAAALAAAGAQGNADFLVKEAFVPPMDRDLFAADRVVVKFESELTPAQIDAAFGKLGATFLEAGEGHDFDVLRVTPGTVDRWVMLLSSLPQVVYAEPDPICWITSTPNDTFFFPYQWNLYDWGTTSNGVASNFGVQGESAWNVTSGAGVRVGIVDTGAAYENFGSYVQAPDLAGATFVAPKDYVNNDLHANDDNGHGTHVCGTIRQSTNNAMGCAGLAYSVEIVPVKVLNASGSGNLTWVADGIRWAADNGCFSINLSLGASSGSSALQSAVDYAWNTKGCVIAAASGNNGSGSISYPARYTNCIAVGATRFDGKRASYSQFGSQLDVMAPGGDVGVDQNGDGYGDGILQQTFSGSPSNFAYYFFEGTSMATPHVTAIAALVKANKPAYTNVQVRAAIETKTKNLGSPGWDNKTGWGLVSAKDALTY